MKLRKFEIVLLLVVALLFTYASAAGMQQQDLANKVLRLHVLANSDDAEDQRIKLCVRDAILAYTEPLLEQAQTQAQVRKILGNHMQNLVNIAQKTLWQEGVSNTITVQMQEEYYPTREYTDFSLPAGRYVGIRVKIGAAQGHNWWCVIFPPMCDSTATDQTAELTKSEVALTHRDGTQYILRFKVAELVGAFRETVFNLQKTPIAAK